LNPTVRFAPDALTLLERYSWPGNIRELENAIVRAAALCDGTIRESDLPEKVRNYRPTNGTPLVAVDSKEEWMPLAEVEARYVARVLEHTRGNKQAAARLLQVDRKTVERILKRHQRRAFASEAL